MTPLVEALVKRAFHRAEPRDANAAIEEVRSRALNAGAGEPVSYEVVVPPVTADEHLTTRILPKLVYFLDCRGLKLPSTPGVFVSLFTPAGLFFIDAGDLVATLAAHRGLSLDEVVRRYGSEGQGDPPLLGG